MKRLLITVLAVLTVSVNCYATAVPDDPIAANVKKFVADQTKRAPKIDVVAVQVGFATVELDKPVEGNQE